MTMRALKLCLLGVLLSILAATPAAQAGVGRLFDATNSDNQGWIITDSVPNQLVPAQRLLVNASTNLTSDSPSLVYIGDLGGNITINLPTVATVGKHARFRFVNAGNTIGVDGNVTFNVTSSGNINNIDTLVVTNTSGNGGMPTFIDAQADGNTTTTNEWYLGIVRR